MRHVCKGAHRCLILGDLRWTIFLSQLSRRHPYRCKSVTLWAPLQNWAVCSDSWCPKNSDNKTWRGWGWGWSRFVMQERAAAVQQASRTVWEHHQQQQQQHQYQQQQQQQHHHHHQQQQQQQQAQAKRAMEHRAAEMEQQQVRMFSTLNTQLTSWKFYPCKPQVAEEPQGQGLDLRL